MWPSFAAASTLSIYGGTARSLLAVMHQDALVFHAAVVIVAPKTAAAVGPCVGWMYRWFRLSTSASQPGRDKPHLRGHTRSSVYSSFASRLKS
jgi:hypothetical protein